MRIRKLTHVLTTAALAVALCGIASAKQPGDEPGGAGEPEPPVKITTNKKKIDRAKLNRVYKVVKGRRSQLHSAKIKGSPGWHRLRITMKGDHIECYYDGKKYLDVKDQTFGSPGRVGLWTKADAQTHFDDFRVTETRLIQR